MHGSIVLELLRSDGIIPLNKKLMRSLGVNTTIIYSELISRYKYFEDRGLLTDDGWFFNTVEDLEGGTTFKEKIQRRCIKQLVECGLIEQELRGVPAKRFFKICTEIDVIMRALSGEFTEKSDDNYVEDEAQISQVDRSRTVSTTATDQSKRCLNNNTINNNKNNKLITSKEVIGTSANPKQKTLIDLSKQEQKQHLEQLASKKRKTKKERAELQIEEARLGLRDWEHKSGKGVSNQSLAIYYANKHLEVLGTDSGFDFSSNADYWTGKFMTHFVERFDIERSNIVDFVDVMLQVYKDKPIPGKKEELTFNMFTHKGQQDMVARLVARTKYEIENTSDPQEKPQVGKRQPDTGGSNEVF